jgi:hypothetical protein
MPKKTPIRARASLKAGMPGSRAHLTPSPLSFVEGATDPQFTLI